MTEPSRSTADLIVECLENEGVTHVFGIPGEENIRLVEAISRSPADPPDLCDPADLERASPHELAVVQLEGSVSRELADPLACLTSL